MGLDLSYAPREIAAVMALNPNAPEVTEVEILRGALQRMTCARLEADTRAHSKERELQFVTKRLQEAEELLKRGEEWQRTLEQEFRNIMKLLEGPCNRPQAVVMVSYFNCLLRIIDEVT